MAMASFAIFETVPTAEPSGAATQVAPVEDWGFVVGSYGCGKNIGVVFILA